MKVWILIFIFVGISSLDISDNCVYDNVINNINYVPIRNCVYKKPDVSTYTTASGFLILHRVFGSGLFPLTEKEQLKIKSEMLEKGEILNECRATCETSRPAPDVLIISSVFSSETGHLTFSTNSENRFSLFQICFQQFLKYIRDKS